MIQLKSYTIHYLPPRALKGTTWIPKGPPSLETSTSFTISLWDNDEWGNVNMYSEWTKKPHTNTHRKTKMLQKLSYGDESIIEYYIPEY